MPIELVSEQMEDMIMRVSCAHYHVFCLFLLTGSPRHAASMNIFSDFTLDYSPNLHHLMVYYYLTHQIVTYEHTIVLRITNVDQMLSTTCAHTQEDNSFPSDSFGSKVIHLQCTAVFGVRTFINSMFLITKNWKFWMCGIVFKEVVKKNLNEENDISSCKEDYNQFVNYGKTNMFH